MALHATIFQFFFRSAKHTSSSKFSILHKTEVESHNKAVGIGTFYCDSRTVLILARAFIPGCVPWVRRQNVLSFQSFRLATKIRIEPNSIKNCECGTLSDQSRNSVPADEVLTQ
jgi:hypothetical protein